MPQNGCCFHPCAGCSHVCRLQVWASENLNYEHIVFRLKYRRTAHVQYWHLPVDWGKTSCISTVIADQTHRIDGGGRMQPHMCFLNANSWLSLRNQFTHHRQWLHSLIALQLTFYWKSKMALTKNIFQKVNKCELQNEAKTMATGANVIILFSISPKSMKTTQWYS